MNFDEFTINCAHRRPDSTFCRAEGLPCQVSICPEWKKRQATLKAQAPPAFNNFYPECEYYHDEDASCSLYGDECGPEECDPWNDYQDAAGYGDHDDGSDFYMDPFDERPTLKLGKVAKRSAAKAAFELARDKNLRK